MLLNKIALSGFQFHSPNALLFFQCALCVAAVQACATAGLVKVEPLRAGVVRVWLPVNAIFVGMIGTSFWALASLNVGMVTGARMWRGVARGCPHLRLVSRVLDLSAAFGRPRGQDGAPDCRCLPAALLLQCSRT